MKNVYLFTYLDVPQITRDGIRLAVDKKESLTAERLDIILPVLGAQTAERPLRLPSLEDAVAYLEHVKLGTSYRETLNQLLRISRHDPWLRHIAGHIRESATLFKAASKDTHTYRMCCRIIGRLGDPDPRVERELSGLTDARAD